MNKNYLFIYMIKKNSSCKNIICNMINKSVLIIIYMANDSKKKTGFSLLYLG